MRITLEPGMTTAELDAVGGRGLYEHYGARSAPRAVYGFPGVNLISVNDEAVHGVPGGRVIKRGDLVKIGMTAEVEGHFADAAVTVALPSGPEVHQKLKECAEVAFARAANNLVPGRDTGALDVRVRRTRDQKSTMGPRLHRRRRSRIRNARTTSGAYPGRGGYA